ncbi:helix-turn-helix domain-containing protein [Sphingomonas bacterium]|uniref:helix-turn-helix domain-containing protein n=1 Tax=Sphingomonas bacterium TaxID=1895847 RepID=UPI0015767C99|nr:helix-turn-helix domain-containing protein [Sphingomonas bacterium]
MNVVEEAVASGEDWNTVLIGQAALLRDQQALGRSPSLDRLFDFLLKCSLEGRSPKEVEIANRVFARHGDGADQDASVRVYVHRLRRKLEDFYTGPGSMQPMRLAIPKGGYRLTLEPAPHASVDASPSAAPPVARTRRWIELLGVAALVILAIVVTWTAASRPDPIDAPLIADRANPLWAATVADGRPLVIVVGDYYVFGETDGVGDVSRLVREFDVNSASDLQHLAATRPDRGKTSVDLGLSYLPVGVASALRVVTPIVRRNDHALRKPTVVPASQLTPDMVKNDDLVYLGYLSGLGSLRDPVFGASRFTIGGTYDEIVDLKAGRHYLAGTHLKSNQAQPSEDYALISSFAGPTGNHVVVIAGTRDAALMQAAEFVTRPDSLKRITDPLHGAPAFEALLAVESLRNVGLRARLLITSPRPREADWSGRQTQPFPDELDESSPTAPNL